MKSLDMYIPQDDHDDQDLGELHVGFTPDEGIQHVHHVREISEQLSSPSDGRRSKY
jgi:hypothetical protein